MARKEGRPAWFKMLRNQKALIDAVPDKSAGRALKAIFSYFEDGKLPDDLEPLEFAVFSAVKPYGTLFLSRKNCGLYSGRQTSS